MPSMLDIPKDPKKIRARIPSYERKLRNEKQDNGPYQSGAGACPRRAPLGSRVSALSVLLRSARPSTT